MIGSGFGEPRWLINRLFCRQFARSCAHIKGDLLDAGCGDMPFFDLLRPRVRSYVGVDQQGRIGVISADLRRLPFAGSSFDTILCLQVIDDFPDPRTVLREFYRVLRNSGTLLLSVNQQWRVHDEPNDFLRYTKYGLRSHLGEVGFRVISVDPMGGFWNYLGNRLGFLTHDTMRAKVPRVIRRIIIGALHVTIGLVFDRWQFLPGDTQTNFAVAQKQTP
jgi:SAM-dependent methyltransferase